LDNVPNRSGATDILRRRWPGPSKPLGEKKSISNFFRALRLEIERMRRREVGRDGRCKERTNRRRKEGEREVEALEPADEM